MSRMTFIDNGLWLSLPAGRALGTGKAGDAGYPPYNIELLPDGDGNEAALRITLAVAGFKPGELDVRIEDGALIISGKHGEDAERNYLHRGIAARQFKRTFALAKGVEVRSAELHNGLLAIELERPSRERQVVKVGIGATT